MISPWQSSSELFSSLRQHLQGAISEYSEELAEVFQHFIAIADAWEAAGLSLAGESTEQPARIEDFVIANGGGDSVLIISVIFAVWRRNGQENE